MDRGFVLFVLDSVARKRPGPHHHDIGAVAFHRGLVVLFDRVVPEEIEDTEVP